MPERERCTVSDPALGIVEVTPFPADAALRGLVPVLQGQQAGYRVMRYRPGKRCTVRTEPVGRLDQRFVKFFADDQGAAIQADSLRLWSAAINGDLEFAVAEPDHWDPATRALWQCSVPGSPVAPILFGPQGGDLAYRMGRALGSIPQSSVKPTRTFDFEVQMERTRRYATALCKRLPSAKESIEDLVLQLGRLKPSGRRAPQNPIHGSPHMHQWLIDQDRLGLVDFDRMSIGDPELDAATFVAEMDYEDPTKVPVKELNREFLDGYQDAAGALDPDLLLSYRLQKHVAKALKAARAVRPDAPQRAMRNLRRASDQLKRTERL